MRIALSLLTLLTCTAFAPRAAWAEKVDMPPAALRKTATHVVTGTVRAIYTRTENAKGWRTTHHLAEVSIGGLEKGAGLSVGGLVYVRYWTRRWAGIGAPPPSTNGHRGIPKQGETLRIYLARRAYDGFGETQDGGFNVLGANGFERLAPK